MTDFDEAISAGLRGRRAGDRPRPRRPRRRARTRAPSVQIPLAMMNRHGLVAGATGTGKTQDAAAARRAAVGRRRAGVRGRRQGRPVRPVASPARPGGAAEKRMTELGLPFAPTALPGRVPRRWAASAPACRCARRSRTSGRSCWPRCSGANETQEQSLGLVFHYADEKGLPLLDLSDLRALLTFLDSDEGKAELEGIGGLVGRDGRRAAARAGRAGGRRRHRVLRRAAARRSPTCCARRPTAAA